MGWWYETGWYEQIGDDSNWNDNNSEWVNVVTEDDKQDTDWKWDDVSNKDSNVVEKGILAIIDMTVMDLMMLVNWMMEVNDDYKWGC